MIEDLASIKDRAAAEGVLAMIEARAHHDDVLLERIRVTQDMAQVVEISWVAYRYQNVARAHAHGPAAQFLIAIDAELIELFGFTVPLSCNVTLRKREDR